MTPQQSLLLRAIQRSGLSPSRFSREVLLKVPSTVTRYLQGKYPVPDRVVVFLQKYVEEHPL